ncbi:nucleotidyltransferase domain-containing protein [Kitasatospora sp. NPDC057198]|uniref:nucleotidyltransferase domain-containing protein n=1 Tax=Kitasatospora sp. NPDC057198 TaxID=3346046 RepID=UPI003632A522
MDTGGPPAGGVRWDAAETDARWAGAWRPEQVARRLEGLAAPWYVAAGWALDLFLGAQTRPHGDLEIAVPAGAFGELRAHFPELEFDAVGWGMTWPDAGAEPLAATRQTWARDPASGRYRFDVFREPHDGDTWICRRDESLRLPYHRIVERTADGIPYLRPELVLLFKAKATRDKDHADFERVLPVLDAERRRTLAGWLRRAHPGHAWLPGLERLEGP